MVNDMVKNTARMFFFTVFLTVLLYSVITTQFINAESPAIIPFISSDPGDDLYASMFIRKVPEVMILHCNLDSIPNTSSSIVYVLDYNLGLSGSKGCGFWPQGFGSRLLELSQRGSTVVLGYNTLRLISIFEPSVLNSLGLVFVEDSRPTSLYIELDEPLRGMSAPEEILYDIGVYHRIVVYPESGWNVLVRFSDGAPAIAEVRIGFGRVILIFFNPVWPAVDGEEETYVELIAALHRYITLNSDMRVQLLYITTVAVAATMVGSAALVSLQKSDDVLRRIYRPIVTIGILGLKYARVDPLKHPVRVLIYRLAEGKPYITVEEVSALGVKRASALWHIEVLMAAGLLASKKVLGKTIYFKPERRQEALLALVLESEHRKRILLELLKGTQTLTRLSKVLGISKSTVKHHKDVMLRLRVIEENGVGYTVSEWARQILQRMLSEVRT